ncbi:NlpC/P60 family protein [Cytobacillus spongiae]|uniref:coiled-coil domain-containing protein n=1 Tax=Cytobacillus spongiae TaxID=2901381 RepID=UPI001F415928|nr:C40 family peptidase [Cytobacillus spongiae]UII55594.1 NlpC/P60 family protein [Cytobacillus spongiae]
MLKKKLLVLNTTILLGLGSVIALPSTLAETNAEKQRKVEQNLTEVQNKLSQLQEQVKRVEEAYNDNNEMIAKTEAEIKATNAEVEALNKEIAIHNESIAKRTEILKKRAESLQETGGKVSYLEVLVGSKDFSDFVDRVFAVVQIAQADSDLIQQHEVDKASIKEKQDLVASKLADLTSKKVELDGMKAQIQEQKKQNDQLKAQLEKEKKENLNKKASLQAEAQRSLASAPSSSNTSHSNGASSAPVYTPPAGNGSLSDVLAAGYKYIGNSVYVFGGGRNQYDIQNGRFDCSGFVHFAFSQAGVRIGASTESLKNTGTPVSTSNMKPGDLVFFDTYKRDGHVGIYLGGGKFIGSQNSTGVAIADMTSGYWKQKFNGRVNRIMN